MIVSVFAGFIFGVVAAGVSMLIGSSIALVLTNTILDSLLLSPYTSIVISRIYGSVYRQANGLELENTKEAEVGV